jgi:hypothetical protein
MLETQMQQRKEQLLHAKEKLEGNKNSAKEG